MRNDECRSLQAHTAPAKQTLESDMEHDILPATATDVYTFSSIDLKCSENSRFDFGPGQVGYIFNWLEVEALSQDSNNTWILSSWILHYFFLLFINACVIRSSLTCRTSASAAKQHLFHLIYFYYNIDNCDYTTCQSRINQNSRRQNISLQSAKCNFCARHKPQTLQSYRPHSFDSVSDDDFFPFLLKWQKCRLTGSDRVLFLGSQLDDASAFRGTNREIRFVWE